MPPDVLNSACPDVDCARYRGALGHRPGMVLWVGAFDSMRVAPERAERRWTGPRGFVERGTSPVLRLQGGHVPQAATTAYTRRGARRLVRREIVRNVKAISSILVGRGSRGL
jgi:hypothetical protein